MKKLKYLFVLLLLLLGCNEKTIEPGDSYSVSGKVNNSKGPVKDVEVRIDSAINWKTTTNDHGEFMINGVTSGNHIFKYGFTDSDGAYVLKSENITVSENIVLNSLLLPIPTHMEPPSEIGLTSMLLKWNSTDAIDFREYKLFRRNTPGLDETTGELVFISTSLNDTSFVENDLLSGESYYYRVYIMNQFGSMGGSNIVSGTTTIGNLILNGDFEEYNSSLNEWQIQRGNGTNYDTTLDDSISYEGNFSLYNKNPKLDPSNHYTTMDSNFPINLIPQATYKLSGWAKAEGQRTDIGGLDIGVTPSGTYIEFVNYGSIGDSVNIDWTYKEVIFQISDAQNLRVHIYIPIEKVWLDNLSLELVQ